jgi:hypothetical protein
MLDDESAAITQLAVAMMRLNGEHPAEVYTTEGYAIWLRVTTKDILTAAFTEPEDR